MPQSIFAAEGTQFIDGVSPAFAPAGQWNLGVLYLGASKSAARRCLGRFDLFGPTVSGRALLPGDVITDAELLLETTSVVGPGGWSARIERITRADWDFTTANWNRYKTGANWTAGGGDVATPPPAVTFASPGVGGVFVIGGLAAFVADAITLRGGLALMRLKADDEQPAQSSMCTFDAVLTSALRPRLRVTYAATPPTPIDRLDASQAGIGGETPARPDAAALPDQPARPETPDT